MGGKNFNLPPALQGALGLAQNGFSAQAIGPFGAGIIGNSSDGNDYGILGTTGAAGGMGVYGSDGAGSGHVQTKPAGVYGESDNGNGVFGGSANWNGVEGDSWSGSHAGVAGVNFSGGPGVWGKSTGNAGEFIGNVQVSGYIHCGTANLQNPNPGCAYVDGDVVVTGNLTANGDIFLPGAADFAEDFDITDLEKVEAGTVMVINPEGKLETSQNAYDKRVAGVISGAGKFKPGIILDKQPSESNRMPIALVGKVYCKVDAGHAPIEVGDMLTTSSTPGHAMRADSSSKAFGAVIGKALQPLKAGRGLVPILIALQ